MNPTILKAVFLIMKLLHRFNVLNLQYQTETLTCVNFNMNIMEY